MTDNIAQETLLKRLQRMEDIEEIRKIYVAYGRNLDDCDPVGYASLFARKCKLRLGGVMRGDTREEVQAAAEKLLELKANSTQKTLHLIASPVIEIDGDTATGQCVWAAVSARGDETPTVPHMGRHVDEFVREEGRWRIYSRRGILDLGSF